MFGKEIEMAEKFFHFHYTVQDENEPIEGDVCCPGDDEEKVTAFMREDVAGTFPDGRIVSIELTAVTDANGKRW